MHKPQTIRDLREVGYPILSVKAEMRRNLISRLRSGGPLFPGIVGYDDTVIPQIENAVLSGHDLVLLGERGQAKTRIARALVSLLDEEVPAIVGCEINCSPYSPICQHCRTAVAQQGDNTEIEWIGRDRRYSEKLATPDITIADLIGEVDPIRVAEGRYLSDELTIHYGLIPRTNRGIFCINELPDLVERIQVGLLNIMEERDVQIRGYKVRLPIDLYVVASANPEDYTNRGRIITPLKDRFGSQVRTHYPRTLEHEIDIMEAERSQFQDNGYAVVVPQFMKEVVAEVTHVARRSGDVSQRSGVSVRVSICNYENVVSSALKRAVRSEEPQAVPRISDLAAVIASTTGKIEIESFGEVREERIVDKIVQSAVVRVFSQHFHEGELADVVEQFESGVVIEAGDDVPSTEYVRAANRVPGLARAAKTLGAGESPAAVASAIEFVLEGLHLSRKLNKDRAAGRARYRK